MVVTFSPRIAADEGGYPNGHRDILIQPRIFTDLRGLEYGALLLKA
jgi:hypothetical protein